jgi:uncharacterized protein
MVKRELEATIRLLLKGYPIVTITGPRQSGKTTLARAIFSDKPYVSLETPLQREFAENDPVGFLQRYKDGAVIDEVQNCPHLFSYLQEFVDRDKRMGLFLLTGSRQFDIHSRITQSLAGRTGIVELLPFTLDEIATLNSEYDVNSRLFTGGYPPLYDREISPLFWYEDYIKTYLERDVRQIINIKDLSAFQRFVKLCAVRTGQILNTSELSTSSGADVKTVNSWLSVLESSYIIYLLRPHSENFSKRIVKRPKLYFYDSGLVCHLIGIQSAIEMDLHPNRGALFETLIIGEVLKFFKNNKLPSSLYFWRDHKGHEIDVIIERGQHLFPVEIKSGFTIRSDFFKSIDFFRNASGKRTAECFFIYPGEEQYTRQGVEVVSWKNLHRFMSRFKT